MNLAESILARASGRSRVEPGEIVVAHVDRLIMHDLSGYLTAGVFDSRVNTPIPDPERVVMVFDHHYSPPIQAQPSSTPTPSPTPNSSAPAPDKTHAAARSGTGSTAR